MNIGRDNPRKLGSIAAFTLVEVCMALGVAVFCLSTVFALLPIGLANNQSSLEQTVANNVASAIVSDLQCAQPLGTGTSPRFGISIPAAGSTNAISTPQTIYFTANESATGLIGSIPVIGGSAVSRYRATVGFAPPASGRTATVVRLLITWPALADPAPGSWPTNYIGSYEANTTLDRN